MKRLCLFLIALSLAVTVANAQSLLRVGLTFGLNPNEMRLDELKTENRENLGFFVGGTVELNLPVLPISLDVSALYDHEKMSFGGDKENVEFIHVPVNVRYNIGLGKLLSFYVAAGPQFTFPISDKSVFHNQYKLKESQLSANLGAGFQLVNHLVVGYRYNIALGDTADKRTTADVIDTVKKENGTHHVFLTYFF